MEFTKDELKAKLEAHALWLSGKGGERLVLKSRADLSGANLSWADLSGADLSRANTDYAQLPLWCGGTRIKIDRRIGLQLLYHFVAQKHTDAECIELAKTLAPIADKFRIEFRNDAPAVPLVE